MSTHDEHKAAVAAAINAAQEVTSAADGIYSRLEGEIMPAVCNATGENITTENNSAMTAIVEVEAAMTDMQEVSAAGSSAREYLEQYNTAF